MPDGKHYRLFPQETVIARYTLFVDSYPRSGFSLIIKRIAILLCYIFKREDGSDCGGVSTRGHGQREGPDGDKWSKTTQETLGGSGVSEANGVLRNHYHPPGATIYI